MENERPDPDALLERVREEEATAKRGKLTIFFGAAPGVGKTYAMLEAARSERGQARDVVVGIVETHGRYDTGSLVLGLELLPRRKLEYRGVKLEEFDLDAALARRPGLILVDELAHTNAEGSRHAKRWQDVEELLDAGIDVYTTLNVQHLESLNDVVAQITHVVVRETVPDVAFDTAHDVKLIDLPPDELLERLRDGKVYVSSQAANATDKFFRKGNLIALRELALRRTAERVDAQMDRYKRDHGIQATWPVAERVLVSVSPSPSSVKLVRAARRMAASLRARWVAAYVETPASLRMTTADRERLAQTMRLAEQLGAETVTLVGASAGETIMRYARAHNVTKLVVGKPTHPRWRDLVSRSFLDEMVRSSGDIDVYVISGDSAAAQAPAPREANVPAPTPASGFIGGVVAVTLATGISALLFGRKELTDVVMVYLLGIVIVSTRFGYAPSVFAAFLSIVAYDLFFIPPFYSLAVADLRHIVTFGVMFLVAIVISGLNRRVREQAAAATSRERRTAALYAMSRELASARSIEALVRLTTAHLDETFECRSSILLPDASESLKPVIEVGAPASIDAKEAGVAEWVWRHHRPAGMGTDTLPSAEALYVSLSASRGPVGVLAVRPRYAKRFQDPEQMRLLETFATQIGTAIERTLLSEEKRAAQLQFETEQLRNTLLSSVSHDLRTPLAVITGAASALVEDSGLLDEPAKHELASTVYEGIRRVNRLVRNLLDMTRVEAGALSVTKEWFDVEEVVGAALHRLEDRLADRAIATRLPADLPLVPFDGVLVEQVLINLLENALKYTPAGTPIEVSAEAREGALVVGVADRGPGMPPEELERIFDKFHRVEREGAIEGIGLGLTISRGIVVAHGGRMWAENRPGGGAAFYFTIPIEGAPPELPTHPETESLVH